MLKIIREYSLADIKDGIQLLLSHSAHSFEVRQHAVQITADRQDKISAIYDWVKQNVRYIPDPDRIEMFISPVRLIQDYNAGLIIGADCDDHAILVTALHRSIGIQSNVVLVDSGGYGLDHAFSEVWSEKLGIWLDIDPTTDFPLGWEHPYYRRISI